MLLYLLASTIAFIIFYAWANSSPFGSEDESGFSFADPQQSDTQSIEEK